jgi:acyl dehydratase
LGESSRFSVPARGLEKRDRDEPSISEDVGDPWANDLIGKVAKTRMRGVAMDHVSSVERRTEIGQGALAGVSSTMSEQESLIPPETVALIGQIESERSAVEITALGAQRYAHAVGDLNPMYFDEEAATAAGYPTLVAPPTYVQYALVASRPLENIREDGLFKGNSALRLRVQRTMFGGEEWDFVAPVCVGDHIGAITRVIGLDEKQGSKGPFVRITRETTYTNQFGNVVARTRQIGIAR